jgi:hypothetical protein
MADRKGLIEQATLYLGQPINPNLKVNPVLGEMADVLPAVKPGEDVKTFADRSDFAKEIYTVDSNGAITAHKNTPSTATKLTFDHWNSRLEYLLVSDVMDAEDQSYLAEKKVSITDSMDSNEVRQIIAGILALSSQEVTQATADDIYEVIRSLKNKIGDYGDNYLLLVGTSVKDLIDNYSKDNASNFDYEVDLQKYLTDAGITVVKVIGSIDIDASGSEKILADDTAIMIARNSTIAQGKPIKFVRRQINPAIAEAMGVTPDAAERAVVIVATPVNLGGINTLGYACYGYESLVIAITNYRAISFCLNIA